MAEEDQSVSEFPEQRVFVRESLFFEIEFRTLSVEDYSKRKEDWAEQRSIKKKSLKREDLDADTYQGTTTLDPLILDFLMQMDDKLDHLIAHLTGKKKVDVATEEGEGIDLGGCGMKIKVASPLTVGALMEGDLLLSRLPLVRIHFFGEVVHVRLTYRDEKAWWEVGVRFLDLDSEDRERIIACVFQRQREVLRRRKGKESMHEGVLESGQ